MDGVPAGTVIPAGIRLAVAGDLAVHLRHRWQRRPAFQQVRDPLRLGLGHRHDRPDRLDEPDEVQAGQRWCDDAAVERDPAVAGADQRLAQERKTDLVPRAVDHHVDLLGAAVAEADAVPLEPVDGGLDDDLTTPQPAQQAVRDRQWPAQQPVTGLGQPVLRHVTPGDPHQQRHGTAPQPQRQHRARAQQRQAVGRPAGQVPRDDVGTGPHGNQGARAEAGTLRRDVARGVPDAEDENTLPGEGPGRTVLMGMNLLTGKGAGPWEGRFRVPGIPVVAVCDEHGAVAPGTGRPGVPRPCRDVPAAAGGRLHPGHLGPEPDAPAESEVIDEVIEVPRDHLVAQVVRVVVRHRERRVLHAAPGRLRVQGAIRARHPVVVAVTPVPADRRARLEAVEGNAAAVQGLARRDPRRTRADDAHAAHDAARPGDRQLISHALTLGRPKCGRHRWNCRPCSPAFLDRVIPFAAWDTRVIMEVAHLGAGARARWGSVGAQRPALAELDHGALPCLPSLVVMIINLA